MNDYASLEKTIVRELSCRLCLCTDVVRLKPLSAELKRKLKKLFDIAVRADDSLPKAICHECLQQVAAMHVYTVKVEKTQKFLDFHRMKTAEVNQNPNETKLHPIIENLTTEKPNEKVDNKPEEKKSSSPSQEKSHTEHQQGDSNKTNTKLATKAVAKKKNSSLEMKYMEAMPPEEFAKAEKVDMTLLNKGAPVKPKESKKADSRAKISPQLSNETLDPLVLVDGRPAKQGQALDKQITLFYKMECCICHESGFNFRSLMKHYKDRHGVPGYVTCCEKKFHYFYPKKIIEHMAFHLQPNIFMCSSCHQNFQTSQELAEHQANGGRSEGKILCPRCSERYPTYHELGGHLLSHRDGTKSQCDYCGKQLKHHHRKKTINHMENIILCSQCIRILRNIEKHEKEQKEKEKLKVKSNDAVLSKHPKFNEAMGLSGDEDASTD